MSLEVKHLMSRKIYHRNDMRPVLIGMGLPAKRLLFLCLSELKRESKKDNVQIRFNADQVFNIDAKDYSYLCNIDYSVAFRQMVNGVKDLRSYILEVDQGLLKRKDTSFPSDWIEPFTIAERGTGYSKGEGFVRIKFAKQMEPLISNLTGDFTGQFLLSAMQLPGGNAGKLYLILREWISSGLAYKRELLFDDFKYDLGVLKIKTYLIFNEFHNLFFRRAVNKLIEKTEFTSITMEIIERKARKAYKVRVSYNYDNKAINHKEEMVERVLGYKDALEVIW